MAGFEPAASCSQISPSQSPDIVPCSPTSRSPGVMLAGHRAASHLERLRVKGRRGLRAPGGEDIAIQLDVERRAVLLHVIRPAGPPRSGPVAEFWYPQVSAGGGHAVE